MIKPITAVKTQHVPQFGGKKAAPAEKTLTHKGTTVHLTGLEADLAEKYETDDRQSTPRRSVARSFYDYLVNLATGHHTQATQEWDEIATGDVFKTAKA